MEDEQRNRAEEDVEASKRVDARARARKAAAFAGLAALAVVAASVLGQQRDQLVAGSLDPATTAERIIVYVAAIVVVVFGATGVRLASSAIRKSGVAHPADGRAASVSFVVSIAGYLAVALVTLSVLRINLQGLLIGGAISGIVIGIAAQQSLGNFFAGIMLLLSRSVRVGDHVFIKSGPLGEHEGRVVEMTLVYVHLLTDRGLVSLPNGGVLAAAIGGGERRQGEQRALDPEESRDHVENHQPVREQ